MTQRVRSAVDTMKGWRGCGLLFLCGLLISPLAARANPEEGRVLRIEGPDPEGNEGTTVGENGMLYVIRCLPQKLMSEDH